MTDPRSLLFVPSNRPDRFEKASRCGADAVILDLEDSVGVSQKAASRDNLQAAADLAVAAGQSVYVRVNPVGTEWHTEDLAAAARIGARGVIVPKCEDADVVDEVDRGLAGGIELVLILETAAGVLAAGRLSHPLDRVRRVSFGAYDFALDMGVVPERAHALMTSARIQVAMAAVAAGVQPLDTAFADVRDPEAMRRQTEEAHGMGFTGKFAIHPGQVPIINEVLSPSAVEIDTAQRIVAAFAEAERDGIAAITVDDKLVDYPIAQRAQATLARAAQFGLVAR
ncbi:CoA ester lyase [Pseudonocardia sp. N23]|uniref:HpcH/HpaI aldolase/citrate lyase family protein n=1 Tax=Pseudonocardia sp. N23 TaxID=1987376 RepID=UPI000BFC6E8A|nr:CoA ester lyase [Pseudonocardia sp. N23]GAY07543.1 citrate lyase beta chain [Pseudonocardia sp. N23]